MAVQGDQARSRWPSCSTSAVDAEALHPGHRGGQRFSS